MIEIQTSFEIEIPNVAVSATGSICLFLPADWDVNEALSHCEKALLTLLHTRFKDLYADKNFPRSFNMMATRLAIRPDVHQLPKPEDYFEPFLEL
jgi:hypothetical protein